MPHTQHRYYYAPIYEGDIPEWEEGSPEPPESVYIKAPGQDSGSGVEFVTAQPACARVLMYDDGLSRCVVRVGGSEKACPGWTLKTPAEVLTDYPAMPGVS